MLVSDHERQCHQRRTERRLSFPLVLQQCLGFSRPRERDRLASVGLAGDDVIEVTMRSGAPGAHGHRRACCRRCASCAGAGDRVGRGDGRDTHVQPEVPLAVKPVPVHSVALVLLHVSVDDCPLVIDVGLAESVAVGTGCSRLRRRTRGVGVAGEVACGVGGSHVVAVCGLGVRPVLLYLVPLDRREQRAAAVYLVAGDADVISACRPREIDLRT